MKWFGPALKPGADGNLWQSGVKRVGGAEHHVDGMCIKTIRNTAERKDRATMCHLILHKELWVTAEVNPFSSQ